MGEKVKDLATFQSKQKDLTGRSNRTLERRREKTIVVEIKRGP